MSKINSAKMFKSQIPQELINEYLEQEGTMIYLRPDDLDKELYKMKYRGYLHCPHYKCRAKLSFTERDNDYKFFSTWKKNIHIDGCPYEVNYKGTVIRSDVYSENVLSELDDEHIRNVMNRTKDMINNIDKDIEPIDEEPQTSNEVINEGQSDIVVGSEDSDDTSKISNRRKGIYKRSVPDVSKRDKGQTRCVYGKVESTFFSAEDRYAYINFIRDDINVKVYFAEWFQNADPASYSRLEEFLDIIERMLLTEQELVLIAIGKVTRPKSGFNVTVDRGLAININGHTFHEILSNPGILNEMLINIRNLELL